MNEEIKYLQLNEIVPGEIHPHLETNNDNLQNMINSIKKYGIITPLLVRPKGNVYEIVLGNRRYKAAQELQLKQVPVIIKELDDKQALELVISDNIQRKELTTKEEALLYNQVLANNNEKVEKISTDLGIPLDRIISKLNILNKKEEKNIIDSKQNNNEIVTKSNSINNDIINLSELNNEVIEREDKFMNNNELLSNQLNQNNMLGQDLQTQNTSEPTFGGKFFPSLEEQSTNMNLNTNMLNNNQQTTPPINNESNLIDLTDLSGVTPQPATTNQQTAEPSSLPSFDINQILNNNSNDPQESLNTNNNLSTIPTIDQNVPAPESNPGIDINISNNSNQQQIDNNINLDNPTTLPSQEESINLNTTDQLPDINSNIDLNTEQSLPNLESLQQNPSQNISLDLNNEPNLDSLPNLNTEEQNMQPMPEPNNLETPIEDQTINIQPEEKNIIPVVNMIKNLAAGFEALGYSIKLEESDESNSYKIQIEVEK